MNNSIYIRRKNKLYLEKGNASLPQDYILNLLKNIEALGYTLSPEVIETLSTLSIERLKPFYKQLIADLQENVGARFQFKPMYPNFPEQVKALSEQELYTNAFWHYVGDWIGQRILTNYQKKEREPLKDNVKLKVIQLGNKEDFNAIYTRLLSAKTSISDADKKDLEWFIKNYGNKIVDLTPDTIPLKENVASFIGYLLKNNLEVEKQFDKHVKTATDVLRVATAISDGDVSLAENTKFKAISNRNRKLLLHSLEKIGAITEDMLRHKNRWKRLGEKLHPFEYKKRFPICCEAFDVIRNDKPFTTFNGKIEKSILSQDVATLINLLRLRPGELARRLDKLLRMSAESVSITEAFKEVSIKVSSPVLLQVHTHFKHRNSPKELRIFFPKGEVGKARSIKNELAPLNEQVCNEIVAICENTLIERFKKYEPLGNVYIDETLNDYTVPFAQRSASKALKTISRGSKINLPAGNTIRFFIYWKDGFSRTDIDLSALALDANSGVKTTIAYYNLKDFGGYHSGDITSAPDGASEFIDIEISKCLEQGVRYILMSVNSYTNQPYCHLPVCFAGFMMRQFTNSGEIYDPVTVENKFDLTANTRVAIPIIIDLVDRKAIWTDISLKGNPSTNNNVHNNLCSTTIINKAMTSLVKPNLYDLFTLHVRARGQKTNDINKANTIFAVDKGIKPTDIDILVSEYL
ncbi:MAG TPA: TerD family protein [Flavobacteriales bacterium]|nr:TerD family protein [Flavobacteriales bacterium]